jgi:UDP-N-acetylmuramate--alanine ligase
MKALFGKFSRVHLVGIGGAGMEGLARLLRQRGARVSGSDRADSPAVEQLRREGFAVQVGHRGELVEGVDLVVYSAAVPDHNPELAQARRSGIPCAGRAEVLGELTRPFFTLAVAGTHGKTTTASMLAASLRRAGLEPGVLIGGWVEGRPQAGLGRGEFFVVEADEFGRSFLHLYPSLIALTSVDAEHLDYYADLEEVQRAFRQFLERLPFYGHSVVAGDGLVTQEVYGQVERPCFTCGLEEANDYRAIEVQQREWGSRFALCFAGQKLGEIELRVPGLHNVRNAALAAALAHSAEVDLAAVVDGLGQFRGVMRRFERKGEVEGVLVIDDYAHHPAELEAALSTARGLGRRIVAVFQPHLYSRTRALAGDFARALSAAERVVLAQVYGAREEPLPGVDSGLIEKALRQQGYGQVEYIADRDRLAAHLIQTCQAGDLVLVMGAGDIGGLADELSRRLEARGKEGTGR